MQYFFGQSFIDLRRDAAYELLELYYPEEYRFVTETRCDGLIFDVDAFIDSPSWATEELVFDGEKVLLIAPQ